MDNTASAPKQNFFKRKNVEISAKRYFQDAFSAMALGLFASLLIGLIIKTIGSEIIKLTGNNEVCEFLVETGTITMQNMGPAMGAAIAWGLKAPPLVIFSSVVTGAMGAATGGPAGAFVAVAVGAEFGKMVSKETRVDIIVTPATTILMGSFTAMLIGPAIGKLMTGLGDLIILATELHPFFFGIIISVIVGLALTAPISSAALCIMLDLSGLAAGAAAAGCCAQMVGFAVISYRDNGTSGLISQGLGTSMLQISNICKNPWILLPPTLAGAITGPISTVVFKMTNNSMGAGMGTSGLVGQIEAFTDMGFSVSTLAMILIVHIILPTIFAVIINRLLMNAGKIKPGDYKLDL